VGSGQFFVIVKTMKKIFIILSGLYLPFLIFSLSQWHFKTFKANYYLNQAEIALKMNNFPRAVENCEKALKINSAAINPYLRYRYGSIILSYGQLLRYISPQGEDNYPGRTEFKRAILLQEENQKGPWPYFTRNYIVAGELSNVLFALGEEKYRQPALSYFKQALILSPRRASIYLKMAQTEMVGRQYGQAEEYIKKALAINENSNQALWQLLLLRIRQRKLADESELYHRLKESGYNFFNFFNPVNELAIAYEQAGRLEKAGHFYQYLSDKWPQVLYYRQKANSLNPAAKAP
jgi:tetratricopeptide (TPR) repeat protein